MTTAFFALLTSAILSLPADTAEPDPATNLGSPNRAQEEYSCHP